MIGKVLKKGTNAYGLMRYLTATRDSKHEVRASVAQLASTISETTPADVNAFFESVLDVAYKHNKPKDPPKHVFHATLRLSENDRRLSQAEWEDAGREIAEQLGYQNYKLILHGDDHLHIFASRIDMSTKMLVDDKYDGKRIVELTQAMAQRLGLDPVPTKGAKVDSSIERAMADREATPPKMMLRQAIREAMAGATAKTMLTASELVERLAVRGVEACPSFAPGGELRGWSFRMGGMETGVSGSRIDPSFAWPQLKKKVEFDPERDAARVSTVRHGFAWAESAGADRPAHPEGVLSHAPAPVVEKVDVVEADRRDDPQSHDGGRPDRHQDRVDGREDAIGRRPSARPVVDGAARGQGGSLGSAPVHTRLSARSHVDDREPARPGPINSQSRTARAIAVARLRTRDFSALRERSKPAVRQVSDYLDKVERSMSLRLEKARRLPTEDFFHKNLRQALKAIEKTQSDLAEACRTARKERSKVRPPRGLDRLSPLKWLRHWEARDKADQKVRAVDGLHALGQRALTEKKRLTYPALDKHRADREAERRQAVAEAEAKNAEDKRILDAARAVLAERPELALKGNRAVLEAAVKRLAEEEAQRRALVERRPVFRPVYEPEPPTGFRP